MVLIVWPVSPGSMISGTEPQWKLCTRACCFGAEHRGAASHGVPQVITSITGNPNGSGQSMGNTALRRFQRHAAGFNLQCPAQARSPTRISLPRFIMASLSTCLSQIATAASTLRFSDASLRRSGPTGPFESSDPGRRRFTSSRAVAARTATARLSQVRASRARAGRVANQIDLNQTAHLGAE